MTLKEKIISNHQVHGLDWTIAWARRNRVNCDTLAFCLFGRYR